MKNLQRNFLIFLFSKYKNIVMLFKESLDFLKIWYKLYFTDKRKNLWYTLDNTFIEGNYDSGKSIDDNDD